MEDCSKYLKKALLGFFLLLSFVLVVIFENYVQYYINDFVFLFYSFICLIYSIKFIMPYTSCLDKYKKR